MESKQLDYQTCLTIMNKIGYEKPTDLQELAFKTAHYGDGAREFIIGTTSSGKTLISIIAYLSDLVCSKKIKKMIYVLPYRALANQKEEDFKSILHRIDDDLSIAISTSEYCISDDDILSGRCDIAIVIYEKAYLFSVKNKSFFDSYDYIVFDEPGIINHFERGLKADFVIQEACNCNNNVYILASPYYNWDLYIQKYGFHEVKSVHRPITIKKKYEIYSRNKGEHYLDCIENRLIDICVNHRRQGHKILVFENTRAGVRRIAKKIYIAFKKKGLLRNKYGSEKDCLNFLINKLDSTQEDLYGIFTDEQDYLAFYNGIFYHNASMPEEVRALIENEFLSDNGILDIVVATETLAYGINSNVDVVIVANLYKPGTGFLQLNEYMNYIGRAGRLGRCQYGYTYTFVQDRDELKLRNLERKIDKPRKIRSPYEKLPNLPERYFYCLTYLSDKKEITSQDILRKFLGYPGVKSETINLPMIKYMLEELKKHGLVKSEYDAFVRDEQYRLTDKGLNFSGFIVEPSVFKDLVLKKNSWLKDGIDKKLFPIIYQLCSYGKMSECGMSLNGVNQIGDAYKYCKHLEKISKELLKNKEIDQSLYNNINIIIGKYVRTNKKNIKMAAITEDWLKIRHLMKAEALYMWCCSRSMRDIESTCHIAYGDLKRLGEKGKYYIDAVNSMVKLEDTGELSAFLVKLSASLFYGIRLDIISHYDILTIEPTVGRQLRTIGQILNIKNPKNSELYHRLVRHVETRFPENMKKLLREREQNEQKN